MKLLLCKECGQVFSLTRQTKTCDCGKTRGKYKENGLNAVYSGDDAIPLGFANGSVIEAIAFQPTDGQGYRFEAFVIPISCPTFIRVKEVQL